MKAFYVVVLIAHWHGHVTHSTQVAGWMTEHQCYSAGPHCLESGGAERPNLCLRMLGLTF